MIGFTKRNLKVFYRDSSVVFFSLLASFITIGLYILFLGDVYTADYEEFTNARTMMEEAMSTAFAGAPVTYLDEYKNTFGITYRFGDSVLNNWVSIVFLLGSGTIFFFLSVLNLSRKKKA